MRSIGAILLAAGASTRMGTVKQLLPWKESTLLEHAIEQLRGAKIDELVVVLGANAEVIRAKITLPDVDFTVNSEWEKGMSTSIATGLRQMRAETPDIQSVLIALVDQPLLDSNYYNKLINIYIGNSFKIVSSKYSGRMGVPALFDRDYFENLMNLTGQEGARRLLRGEVIPVGEVSAEELAVDLDTKAEYERIYHLHINFLTVPSC